MSKSRDTRYVIREKTNTDISHREARISDLPVLIFEPFNFLTCKSVFYPASRITNHVARRVTLDPKRMVGPAMMASNP